MVAAQDQNCLPSLDQLRIQDKLQERDRIDGYGPMSQEERNTYKERQRQATTEDERNRIRNAHRERMELRKRALNGVGNRGADAGAGPVMGGKLPVIILDPKNGCRN